jgi:hypothetical protein
LLRVVRRRRRLVTRERNPKPPRILRTSIRSGGRTRSATGAARRDILSQPAQSNRSAIMTISQFAHPSRPAIQWQQYKSMKILGKAMTQISEIANFDDELFEEQSHAQLGVVSVEDARSEPQSG